MSSNLRGIELTGVYMDEAAELNPKEYDKCRTCGVWKLIHYTIDKEAYHKDSCKDYLPTDNLEYLELMENRATLRKWYEHASTM